MKGGPASCLSKALGIGLTCTCLLPIVYVITAYAWFLVVGKSLNVKRDLRRGTRRMVRLNGTNVARQTSSITSRGIMRVERRMGV